MKKRISILSGMWSDFRIMGVNALVPIFMISFVFIFITLLNGPHGFNVKYIVQSSEYVFPVFASWWSIFLLRHIIELPGGELYFTYPSTRLYYGLGRILRGYVIYNILVGLECFAIGLEIKSATMIDIWTQIGSQSLFYACLGFLSMSITRNSAYSLVIVGGYALFYIFTNNKVFRWLSIYLFNESPINYIDFMKQYSFKNFMLSIVILLFAQLVFFRLKPLGD